MLVISKKSWGADHNVSSGFYLLFQFELIFCIAELENKPLLKVLRELMEQYPDIPVSMFQGVCVCVCVHMYVCVCVCVCMCVLCKCVHFQVIL